jgi:hypothetical protein
MHEVVVHLNDVSPPFAPRICVHNALQKPNLILGRLGVMLCALHNLEGAVSTVPVFFCFAMNKQIVKFKETRAKGASKEDVRGVLDEPHCREVAPSKFPEHVISAVVDVPNPYGMIPT